MAGVCPVHGGANNQGSGINFYPNDRINEGAPAPEPSVAALPMPILEDAWIKAYDMSENDYSTQAGDLFRLMSEDQKQQLANNIAGGLIAASESVQERMLSKFVQADPDYGKRVADAIKSLA